MTELEAALPFPPRHHFLTADPLPVETDRGQKQSWTQSSHAGAFSASMKRDREGRAASLLFSLLLAPPNSPLPINPRRRLLLLLFPTQSSSPVLQEAHVPEWVWQGSKFNSITHTRNLLSDKLQGFFLISFLRCVRNIYNVFQCW